MAQHEEIVLWLDRRWKNAIEKHLKGETLQEHLETVLDALCNQLPQREYERISRFVSSVLRLIPSTLDTSERVTAS